MLKVYGSWTSSLGIIMPLGLFALDYEIHYMSKVHRINQGSSMVVELPWSQLSLLFTTAKTQNQCDFRLPN